MSKANLINEVVALRAAQNGSVSASERANLEVSTVEFLEQQLHDLKEQAKQRYIQEALAPIREQVRAQVANDPAIQTAQAERVWNAFFFRHPEYKNCTPNRTEIKKRASSLSDDGTIRLEHLEEAFKLLVNEGFGFIRQKIKIIPTASNLPKDQETLTAFCKAHGLRRNAASLGMLREEFGAGFGPAEISQALQSGLIAFDKANQEEIDEWTHPLGGKSREQLVSYIERFLERSHPSEAPDTAMRIRQAILDPSVPIAGVRNRIHVASEIADSFSSNVQANALQFRKLFLSVTPTEELRTKVVQIQERQTLNKMSREELRQHIAQQRQTTSAQQVQQEQTARDQAHREQAEAGKHPPLPLVKADGTKLDRQFFENLINGDRNQRQLYRDYCVKFGFSQITTRMQSAA